MELESSSANCMSLVDRLLDRREVRWWCCNRHSSRAHRDGEDGSRQLEWWDVTFVTSFAKRRRPDRLLCLTGRREVKVVLP